MTAEWLDGATGKYTINFGAIRIRPLRATESVGRVECSGVKREIKAGENP